MGSSVEVLVVGGSPDLLDRATASIDRLEQCWSRFLPSSDISRLNHAAGSTVHIDPATSVLLAAMLDGWRATAGAFDPTMLSPLVGLGYATSWHDPSVVTSVPSGASLRANLDELSIDRDRNVATAPRGMCLDPGGIGKGLAADLVVNELIEAGADGASVSIGGDVCVRGRSPQDAGWLIGIADPMVPHDTDVEIGQLMLVQGGVATSGTLCRRWTDANGESVHHLLDPSTGRPVKHSRELVAVTVVAGSAAWAEIWTKAVMVRGVAALDLLDHHGLGGRVTYADATTSTNRSWSLFECPGAEPVATRSGEQGRDGAGDEVEMVEV